MLSLSLLHFQEILKGKKGHPFFFSQKQTFQLTHNSTFELRVQTNGDISPRSALVQACRDLVSDLGTLSREFTKEWELRKMVQAALISEDSLAYLLVRAFRFKSRQQQQHATHMYIRERERERGCVCVCALDDGVWYACVLGV
jgi:hypothetical protein